MQYQLEPSDPGIGAQGGDIIGYAERLLACLLKTETLVVINKIADFEFIKRDAALFYVNNGKLNLL